MLRTEAKEICQPIIEPAARGLLGLVALWKRGATFIMRRVTLYPCEHQCEHGFGFMTLYPGLTCSTVQ